MNQMQQMLVYIHVSYTYVDCFKYVHPRASHVLSFVNSRVLALQQRTHVYEQTDVKLAYPHPTSLHKANTKSKEHIATQANKH